MDGQDKQDEQTKCIILKTLPRVALRNCFYP
jgi:hypothetical protein